MVSTLCDYCGGPLHWDWSEAFSKFGFNDGDGQIETWQVADALIEAGYHVKSDKWGLHNLVITSILKDGVELIPDRNSTFTFGYDDPRDYLPDDLVRLLDDEFPVTVEHTF